MSDFLVIVDPSTEVIEVEGGTIVEVAPAVEVIEVEGSTSIEIVENNTFVEVVESDPQEIIHEGVIGPEGPAGPPGTFEDEEMLSKRVDFVGDDLYRGEAAVGSLTSDAVWRIRFVAISPVDSDIAELWAGGTSNYDKVWDDRAGLVYT